ncbi:MAG: UMP kinase [Dehalococcoidia bacterium]|nr:UMP kinase [Dehalococcoidia bacterium]MXY21107.1 UMP kinase [Dehalococcoidia bacterium]MYA62900.1 UMP kinase [Dehalococcoidia bacterium]
MDNSSPPNYKRILLKLSGESLRGDRGFGIDPEAVEYMGEEVNSVLELGVEMGIVVGGGNIWRGTQAELDGMDRATADYAGMLATIISALALQDTLERKFDIVTRTQSAINVSQVAEPYIRRRAIRHLEKGRVVLFAAGTGNPFVTTDTGAALRAVEIGADVLLMAKNNVDGVYEDDPRTNPDARKLEHVTYFQALEKRLGVMDTTALSLCMDNEVPIIVFDLFEAGNLQRIVRGESIGSVVSS